MHTKNRDKSSPLSALIADIGFIQGSFQLALQSWIAYIYRSQNRMAIENASRIQISGEQRSVRLKQTAIWRQRQAGKKICKADIMQCTRHMYQNVAMVQATELTVRSANRQRYQAFRPTIASPRNQNTAKQKKEKESLHNKSGEKNS